MISSLLGYYFVQIRQRWSVDENNEIAVAGSHVVLVECSCVER